jgi:hypothetical protein
MSIGAIDVPVPAGLLIASSLFLLSVWYWHRLGGEQFDVSTRALRRGTLIFAVLAIFALLRAASFVDSEVSPRGYVIAWLSALGLMSLTVLLLVVDVVNSLRVHHRAIFRDTLGTTDKLREQIANAEKKADEAKDDREEASEA